MSAYTRHLFLASLKSSGCLSRAERCHRTGRGSDVQPNPADFRVSSNEKERIIPAACSAVLKVHGLFDANCQCEIESQSCFYMLYILFINKVIVFCLSSVSLSSVFHCWFHSFIHCFHSNTSSSHCPLLQPAWKLCGDGGSEGSGSCA